MRGTLFTRAFLEEGITETARWQALDPKAFDAFRAAAAAVFGGFPHTAKLNEADTEKDVIWKVLEALGWQLTMTQQTASGKGRTDVPDVLLLLLFIDAVSKDRALAETNEGRRYRHGLSFVESKKWMRPLDRAESTTALDDGTPSNQMRRYLSRVEAASDRRITWGILTNGRQWRLYWQGARARSEDFLELDLPVLVQMPGLQPDLFAEEARRSDHYLRVFYLLFGREAFLADPADAAGRTFHRLARDEGRHWEARVSEDLSKVVFAEVFPDLVRALAGNDRDAPSPLTGAYLAEVREAALTLLYRLLFLLYAEDRNLLPANDERYDDYSLRKIREDVAKRVDAADTFSASARRYHHHLNDLFRAIDQGDPSIGLPAYDGGLFQGGALPVLDRTLLPDSQLAPLLDRLCRLDEGGERKWINFPDLSVQHLGSIYERLLDFEARLASDGSIEIRPNAFARRTSGSYYTHDELVELVIERSVGPLVEDRLAVFAAEAEALATDGRSKRDRMKRLEGLDPAERILALRVCDPAMGSGHFLVSLVDYLADRVLEEMDAAPERVFWAPRDYPYRSPVADEVTATRERILEAASAQGWTISTEQLDDRHIVRRMILKRVVFGVDRNPMAVELAKVALWLHTFTAGAPLSFLDHHLVCGDSLLGESLGPVLGELHDRGALLIRSEVARIESVTSQFDKIGLMADADITEVQAARDIMGWVARTLDPLRRFLDVWAAAPEPDLPGAGRRRWARVAQRRAALVPGGEAAPPRLVARGPRRRDGRPRARRAARRSGIRPDGAEGLGAGRQEAAPGRLRVRERRAQSRRAGRAVRRRERRRELCRAADHRPASAEPGRNARRRTRPAHAHAAGAEADDCRL